MVWGEGFDEAWMGEGLQGQELGGGVRVREGPGVGGGQTRRGRGLEKGLDGGEGLGGFG